ncbi:MAG TPA: AbrB/MazE/SpoVT family DNA-binding domain-containing protein [Actinomycetota bacterium]
MSKESAVDVGATVTSKGQITLPKPVREALGLEAGDRVLFRVHDGRAVLAKVPDFLDLAGSVPVPPGKRGASWARVRAETWKRAVRR